MTELPNRFVSKLWTQPISGDYSFSYEREKSNDQKQLKKRKDTSKLRKGRLAFKLAHCKKWLSTVVVNYGLISTDP